MFVDGEGHELPLAYHYDAWGGPPRRRGGSRAMNGQTAKFWQHDDGRRERVREDGAGYDEPPSWERERRREAARKQEADELVLREAALARLAANGCNLDSLSGDEFKLLRMERPSRRPVREATGGDVNPVDFGTTALLAMCVGGGMSGIISRQAQQTLIDSGARLPSKMDPRSRAVLEEAGVVFGERQGTHFLKVTLPREWTLVPDPSPIWNYLLDENGRRRALVCYKGEVYDEHASLSALRRFEVRCEYVEQDSETVRGIDCASRGLVWDGDHIIHVTERFETIHDAISGSDHLMRFYGRDRAREAAAGWLKANFPLCDDPGAYWSK